METGLVAERRFWLSIHWWIGIRRYRKVAR